MLVLLTILFCLPVFSFWFRQSLTRQYQWYKIAKTCNEMDRKWREHEKEKEAETGCPPARRDEFVDNGRHETFNNIKLFPRVKGDLFQAMIEKAKHSEATSSSHCIHAMPHVTIRFRFPKSNILQKDLEQAYEFNNTFKEAALQTATVLSASSVYVWGTEVLFMLPAHTSRLYSGNRDRITSLINYHMSPCFKYDLGVPKVTYAELFYLKELTALFRWRMFYAYQNGLSNLVRLYSGNKDASTLKQQTKLKLLEKHNVPVNVMNKHILYGTYYQKCSLLLRGGCNLLRGRYAAINPTIRETDFNN